MLTFRRPRISAFGKLPFAGDFLSFGEAKGTGAEWTDLLNTAFSSIDATASRYYSRRVYRFWYRGERERMLKTPVGGFLADSHDRLGRRFPFTVFTSAPNSESGCAAALRAGTPVWNALSDPFDRSRGCGSAEDLYQFLDGVDMQKLIDRETTGGMGSDITVQNIIDGVAEGSADLFCAILGRLIRNFSYDAEAVARAGVIVKIPLNSGYSARAQAQFWATVLDGRPGASKANSPNVLIPGARRSDDKIYFFFRDLTNADGPALFSEEPALESAFDLASIRSASLEPDDVACGQRSISKINVSNFINTLKPEFFWQ